MAITIPQSNSAQGSKTVATPGSVTKGNMLVVFVFNTAGSGYRAGLGYAVISDSLGNHYRRAFFEGNNRVNIFICRSSIAGGAASTFTVGDGPAASNYSLAILEVAGSAGRVASVCTFDPSQDATTVTDTAIAVNTQTRCRGNGHLVLGGMTHTGATTTITPDAAFTQVVEAENPATGPPFSVIREIQTMMRPVDGTWWTLGASRTVSYLGFHILCDPTAAAIAPAVRGVGTMSVNATTATIVTNYPTAGSAPQFGDILYHAVFQDMAQQVIGTPSGWAKLLETNATPGRGTVFAKVFQANSAGETSVSVTKPVDDNLLVVGVVVAIAGACTGSISGADQETETGNGVTSGVPQPPGLRYFGAQATASSATITAPNVFFPLANCLVVFLGLYGDDFTTSGVAGGTDPTFAENSAQETTTGDDASIMVDSGVTVSGSGTTGARTLTMNATSAHSLGVMAVFEPWRTGDHNFHTQLGLQGLYNRRGRRQMAMAR
jgi:hypothetical protein